MVVSVLSRVTRRLGELNHYSFVFPNALPLIDLLANNLSTFLSTSDAPPSSKMVPPGKMIIPLEVSASFFP